MRSPLLGIAFGVLLFSLARNSWRCRGCGSFNWRGEYCGNCGRTE
jgi:hypothetical protein